VADQCDSGDRVRDDAEHRPKSGTIVPLQCEPLALQTTPQILRGIQEIVASNSELTLDGKVEPDAESGGSAALDTGDAVRLTAAGARSLTAGPDGAEVLIWETT